MSEGAGNWCLIESDPGVFSELVRGFGVSGIQVEELYSLDAESFSDLKPVYGLIFLFKFDGSAETASEGSLIPDPQANEIFFAKQVIHNACATQAILNLILNTSAGEITLGDTLGDFKEFTKSFDPQSAGLAISNAEQLRSIHNSFARHQVLEIDMKTDEKEDVFHFVGYLPINGRLYELDGLQQGPLDHGEVDVSSPDAWLPKASQVIQARIEKYAGKEIRFNLMALVADKRMKYQAELQALESTLSDSEASDETLIEIARIQSLLEAETAKLKQYKLDNLRRRHNYIPLIINLMQVMAEQNKLSEFYETAKNRSAELRKSEKGK